MKNVKNDELIFKIIGTFLIIGIAMMADNTIVYIVSGFSVLIGWGDRIFTLWDRYKRIKG